MLLVGSSRDMKAPSEERQSNEPLRIDVLESPERLALCSIFFPLCFTGVSPEQVRTQDQDPDIDSERARLSIRLFFSTTLFIFHIIQSQRGVH